jgi:hypothetical protein
VNLDVKLLFGSEAQELDLCTVKKNVQFVLPRIGKLKGVGGLT